MTPQFVYFTDPALIREGLWRHDRKNTHDQHMHVLIKPPHRQDPAG